MSGRSMTSGKLHLKMGGFPKNGGSWILKHHAVMTMAISEITGYESPGLYIL